MWILFIISSILFKMCASSFDNDQLRYLKKLDIKCGVVSNSETNWSNLKCPTNNSNTLLNPMILFLMVPIVVLTDSYHFSGSLTVRTTFALGNALISSLKIVNDMILLARVFLSKFISDKLDHLMWINFDLLKIETDGRICSCTKTKPL